MNLSEPQVRTLAEKCGWEVFDSIRARVACGRKWNEPTIFFDEEGLDWWFALGPKQIPLSDETGLLLNVLLTSKGWKREWIFYSNGEGVWFVEKDDMGSDDSSVCALTPTSTVLAAILSL